MHIHLHCKAFWQKLLPCFFSFCLSFQFEPDFELHTHVFFCWFFFFRKIGPTTQPLHYWTASRHESIHKKGIFFFPFRYAVQIFFPSFSLLVLHLQLKVCLIGLIVLRLPGNICQAKLCGPPIGPAQLLSNFEGREIDGMKHRWSSQLDGSENETHYRHL